MYSVVQCFIFFVEIGKIVLCKNRNNPIDLIEQTDQTGASEEIDRSVVSLFLERVERLLQG